MKVAYIASEVFPYAKTGGLGDVAGTLPKELAKLGNDVKVFMPKYNLFSEIDYGLHYQWKIGGILIPIADRIHSVHVQKAYLPESNGKKNSKVEIYFIDCPYYYYRYRVYTDDPDEDERFILFSKSVLEVIKRLNWSPDIIHCNDWHTGIIPLLIKDQPQSGEFSYSNEKVFERTATIFTIHNIAYQGIFDKHTFEKAGINPKYFLNGGHGEYYGKVSFLKTGIMVSDIINTVSETYAKELLTPEYGSGMDPFLNLRKEDFYGVLNGVDYNIWNPETDKLIPYNYSKNDLSGKLKNKKYLLENLGLTFDENIPLIGIISRLVEQKGFDILNEVLDEIITLNAHWVILGSGKRKYEEMFAQLAQNHPKKFSAYIGYNDEFAHLIEAGADMILMPSVYEPCGLNQIYSLKYGTVPIVRKTGGLADTVLDWHECLSEGKEIGTGYSFVNFSGSALLQSLKTAINDFHNKDLWRKIQLNGMEKDYSWQKSAEKYMELYKKATKRLNNGSS
ncbi:glycogen synthase GlgA [Melioribacteraceae bacterium 4301-Me]|uniref:glycogen synthase GlgA n=1 Tax=Pyranulibacter aquaticus TaxID=3163344 RepID=UPI00359598CA